MNTAVALSFKERLAARRKELESAAAFVLPVPGYDDLYARYRILGFEEMRDVGRRVEQQTEDQTTAERLTAAETLVEACEALLERTGTDDNGRPIYQELGYRWTAKAAQDLFEIPLPEGVSAPTALTYIFPYPRDMLMMTHFQEFVEQGMSYLPQIEEALQGES